jgi:hypothetical protein
MGKNVLNKFRQDNGYKQKTYQKIWDGQEDNVYLMDIIRQILPTNEVFEDLVYECLNEKYKKVISNSIK